MKPTAVAVIPARLASTRLPRKMLADLCGRPLLWHTWHRVRAARRISDVVVAVDGQELADAVRSWGGQAILTVPECSSGTLRVASIADQLPGDLILNVQGDEPLVDSALLDEMVELQGATSCPLVTAAWRLNSPEELHNPNIVKVVRGSSGRALYFSRTPIPFVRDVAPTRWLDHHAFWGHIGVYGFRKETLRAYAAAPVAPLEAVERLEQLRFLDLGLSFDIVEAQGRSQAVDTAEDLHTVTRLVTR